MGNAIKHIIKNIYIFYPELGSFIYTQREKNGIKY